jgi:hypothetical protein
VDSISLIDASLIGKILLLSDNIFLEDLVTVYKGLILHEVEDAIALSDTIKANPV